MKIEIITCCRECPFYDGSDKEMALCTHPISEKRGVYNNIVSRSHFKKEPVEEWCPIKEKGYEKVNRDHNDKIISIILYLVKDNTEG